MIEVKFMLGINLVICGLLVFLNGVNHFTNFDKKILGLLNLMGSAILVLNAVVTVAIAGANIVAFAGATAAFIFAINLAVIGVNYKLDRGFTVYGWFALYATIFALAFGINAILNKETIMAVLWFLWAQLWFVSFVNIICKSKLAKRIAPYNLILSGLFTMGLPGTLMLLGVLVV
jgi:hypothetical protein